MRAHVSSETGITLSEPLPAGLGFAIGDELDVDIHDGQIVLSSQPTDNPYPRIIKDPLTGWPVLSAGPDAPMFTSEEVRELLQQFP